MKKIFLVIHGLLISFFINAQITITLSDYAKVGDKYIIAKDNTTQLGNINSYASAPWIFTNLICDEIDTIKYISPSGVPGFDSTYIEANLAIDNAPNYTFYKTSSTKVEVLGSIIQMLGIDFKILLNDKLTVRKFPMNSLTNFTDVGSFIKTGTFQQFGIDTVIPGVDSIEVNLSMNVSSTINGAGVIQTPKGNFSALREHHVVIQSLTISSFSYNGYVKIPIYTLKDTTDSYLWHTNSIGYPLLELIINKNGDIQQIYYLKEDPNSVKEINTNNTIKIYPNPTIEKLIVETNALNCRYYAIYDMNGKKIKADFITSQQNTIDVSNLSSGIYMLSIFDDMNSIYKYNLSICR